MCSKIKKTLPEFVDNVCDIIAHFMVTGPEHAAGALLVSGSCTSCHTVEKWCQPGFNTEGLPLILCRELAVICHKLMESGPKAIAGILKHPPANMSTATEAKWQISNTLKYFLQQDRAYWNCGLKKPFNLRLKMFYNILIQYILKSVELISIILQFLKHH